MKFKIPEEFQFIYEFRGAIFPARAEVSLFDLGTAKIRAVFPDSNHEGFLEVSGQKGEFKAALHLQVEVDDILSFRNVIRTQIGG